MSGSVCLASAVVDRLVAPNTLRRNVAFVAVVTFRQQNCFLLVDFGLFCVNLRFQISSQIGTCVKEEGDGGRGL